MLLRKLLLWLEIRRYEKIGNLVYILPIKPLPIKYQRELKRGDLDKNRFLKNIYDFSVSKQLEERLCYFVTQMERFNLFLKEYAY